MFGKLSAIVVLAVLGMVLVGAATGHVSEEIFIIVGAILSVTLAVWAVKKDDG